MFHDGFKHLERLNQLLSLTGENGLGGGLLGLGKGLKSLTLVRRRRFGGRVTNVSGI